MQLLYPEVTNKAFRLYQHGTDLYSLVVHSIDYCQQPYVELLGREEAPPKPAAVISSIPAAGSSTRLPSLKSEVGQT